MIMKFDEVALNLKIVKEKRMFQEEQPRSSKDLSGVLVRDVSGEFEEADKCTVTVSRSQQIQARSVSLFVLF